MILLFFQVGTSPISILPFLLIALVFLFVSKVTLNSIRKEIIEFKQTMDKPTLNGQLMFKSGECLINFFKWGLIGTIISSILLILEGPYKDLYSLIGGLIALFTAVYMFSRTIAIAFYLKGGKSE